MNPLGNLKLEAENNSWSHAYLFIGRGDSKVEEIIQFIAEKKEAAKDDISIIAPEETSGKAGEIKIDQIRKLIHATSLSPRGKTRIGVIVNSERLNQSSGNILLKSLEEPNKSVIFVLFASKDCVLPTIKSRCRVVYFGFEENTISHQDLFLPEIYKGFFAASKKIEDVIKNNQINSLLDELRRRLEKKMIETKEADYAGALFEVEEARKRISANANQRLTLENLVLKLEKKI